MAPGEASSPTENFLNIKFILKIFLYSGTILACLDLDPLTHLNLDPKHWLPFFVQFVSFCRITHRDRNRQQIVVFFF
jgi:hypothetical protein